MFGSTVDLGTTVMVFADSPAAHVTAVAVVVDLNVTDGGTPARLVGGASFGLDSTNPAGLLEAFNAQVVPELSEITSAYTVYELGAADLILTVEGQVLTFTYVAPGGDVPAYLS